MLRKLLYFVMMLGITAAAFAKEAKNALLIANSSYPQEIGGNLSEPISEAEALKTALESIGFEVTLEINADRETMDIALQHFKEKTKKASGIAFFHYGGHAVQVNGINYLIPAHTKIEDESKVRYRCIELDEIMESMGGEANIAILDSCRNNPFGKSRGGGTRGLAAVNRRPPNSSIIIYAAGAGQTAQDGVFTPVLTKKITKKDKTIEDILKEVTREVQDKTGDVQRPAAYTQLKEDIFLAGRTSSVKTLTGSLLINSEFAGTVSIDGEKKGSIKEDGSLLIEGLRTGSCMVAVTSELNAFKKKVKITADARTVVNIKTGTITLTSEVSGSIYLNGIYYGTVSRSKPAVLAKLGEGTYRVEVHTDSNTFKKEAKVRVGETTAISVYKPEEYARKTETAAKNEPVYEDFYAPGFSIGYSFSHLTVSDIASFNAHGLDLKFEPMRFALGSFDLKGFCFGYSYSHAVIDSGNHEKNEKFDYHEFNVVPLKLGGNLGWFSFHIGGGLSLLWENTPYLKLKLKNSADIFKIGFIIPIDIGITFADFIGIYTEYKPTIVPIESSIKPFVKHSLNVGLSFCIPVYF